MIFRTVTIALATLLLWAGTASAEPTRLTVRVMAKDAKFIGTSIGGAQITIRDVDTGELLAQGVTEGSTGDTAKLVEDDRERGVRLSSRGSAEFTATLDITEPRQVEITAYGPLAQRQGAARASVTHWLVPGKHVSAADGVILELPGFIVDILSPPGNVTLGDLPVEVPLKVNVTLMCGCLVQPDGLWDADKYEVVALVRRDGASEGKYALEYAGSPSQFLLDMTVHKAGLYDVIVYAYDSLTGNTGLDRVTFRVTE